MKSANFIIVYIMSIVFDDMLSAVPNKYHFMVVQCFLVTIFLKEILKMAWYCYVYKGFVVIPPNLSLQSSCDIIYVK